MLVAHKNHPKQAKYRAQVTIVNGIRFASKREAKRYVELRILEASGAIADLRLQVRFELAPSVILNGRKKPALRYYADFVYTNAGKQVIEDCKGVSTPLFRVKLHLMKVLGFDVILV